MSTVQIIRFRLRNAFWTIITVAGMMGLAGMVGYTLGGPTGFFMAALGICLLTVVAMRSMSAFRLHVPGGRELTRVDAPGLILTVARLARRAGLSVLPRVIYLPHMEPLAFSAGSGSSALIAVSDGLLRRLDDRELTGVLAHEISHLANDDIHLLALSEVILRMTSSFSQFGALLLLFSLPAALLFGRGVPLTPCLILLSAPLLSMLLRLFLSRTREFEADLGAARLTGDPGALMSALAKIESGSRPFWHRFLNLPTAENLVPEWLRTHPDTRERIARLAALHEEIPVSTAIGNGRPWPLATQG